MATPDNVIDLLVASLRACIVELEACYKELDADLPGSVDYDYADTIMNAKEAIEVAENMRAAQ